MRITEFLEPFFPDEQEPLWMWWIYPDKKTYIAGKKLLTRYELSHDKKTQEYWIERNRQNGIYFTVNTGGTKIAEITRTNAVFCERDDGTFEDQHQWFDDCPIAPSIRIETLKSVHGYWLLQESIGIDIWKDIQCGLINYFHSDEKLKNANRIMRLPFFKHVKLVDQQFSYKAVVIHTFNPDKRWDGAALKQAFPFSRPKPTYYEPSSSDSWEVMKRELSYRISLHPTYRLESNRKWGTCKGVCHDGNGNTGLAVNWKDMFVYCQKGCSLAQIASTFGVMMPEKKIWSKSIEDRVGKSKTYEWLRDYRQGGLA